MPIDAANLGLREGNMPLPLLDLPLLRWGIIQISDTVCCFRLNALAA